MLWCLRLIGVGVGRFDGIDGNYWQCEQLAGAGDVVGALAAAVQSFNFRRPINFSRLDIPFKRPDLRNLGREPKPFFGALRAASLASTIGVMSIKAPTAPLGSPEG